MGISDVIELERSLSSRCHELNSDQTDGEYMSYAWTIRACGCFYTTQLNDVTLVGSDRAKLAKMGATSGAN